MLCDACCIGWGVFFFTQFPVLCLYQHTRRVCGPNTITNESHHFFVVLVISSKYCDIIRDGVNDFHARVYWWNVHMQNLPFLLEFPPFFPWGETLERGLPVFLPRCCFSGSSSLFFVMLFILVAELVRRNCMTELGAAGFVPLNVLPEVFFGLLSWVVPAPDGTIYLVDINGTCYWGSI